jgi:1-aminocyclopropane-1-carboxylate deaminase/D-cysteine desulfhydrase-like pyridoxal-dependent ACC family enzyme
MAPQAEPALFRQRPWLRGVIPHHPLGTFPTAVERVEGLLPRGVELWVKREDRAGTLYGGNKVRKLEFLIARALAEGRRQLFTIGGWGSHHALATAIYARAVGLGCELALFPQPPSAHVGEQLRADLAAGAEVHAVDHLAAIGPRVLAARLDRSVAYLAGGGSSVDGTLGWVSAADELREQIVAGELPGPDVIYVALGSCGTAAGLLAGFSTFRVHPDEIVGVRVVDRPVSGAGRTRSLAERTFARLWRSEMPMRPYAELRVEHGQIGAGYGHSTPAAEAAVVAAARVGLLLETTYTGKAMAQLLADAAAGRLDRKRVLFWHTYSSVDLAPLLAHTPAEIPEGVRRALSR